MKIYETVLRVLGHTTVVELWERGLLFILSCIKINVVTSFVSIEIKLLLHINNFKNRVLFLHCLTWQFFFN